MFLRNIGRKKSDAEGGTDIFIADAGEKKVDKFIYQNDADCLPVISKVGCFFRSCGIIAELQTGKRLTAKQLNVTWEWARSAQRINALNNICDSASIATRFLRVLGDEKGKFYEVGLFKDGSLAWYPSIKKYNPEMCHPDYLIQKITQNGPSGTHFRVVDTEGNLIQDPHDPAIKVVDVCYSIIYKYAVAD